VIPWTPWLMLDCPNTAPEVELTTASLRAVGAVPMPTVPPD
jgi:hypothetical protein